jgi:hypothetical protein
VAWRGRVHDALAAVGERGVLSLAVSSQSEIGEVNVSQAFTGWLESKDWTAPSSSAPRKASVRNENRPAKSKRAQRAKLRERTRRLFDKNPYRTAKAIIKGTFAMNQSHADSATIQSWKESTESLSEAGLVELDDPGNVFWVLADPVSHAEVAECVRSLRNGSAPGPDGATVGWVKTLPPSELAQWFTLFLYTGSVPRVLNDARVTLIPKTTKPTEPSDYRPIAISSVILRVFHKILEKRLRQIPISVDQKGFREVDGTRDHSFVLRSVIRIARQEKTPLFICFIDMKNAFGAVSHQGVIEAARAKGVPPPILK